MNDLVMAAIGGALIGLAALMMLYFQGRIAGISGIVGGALKPVAGDFLWRAAFIGGLAVAGVVAGVVAPATLAGPSDRGLVLVGVAGLLVGWGTRMGNGCTSGHGVCGMGRRSGRSIVATLTFMITGVLTASLVGRF